ncbi:MULTISPECIES: glycosyltransferase [Pseudonocardia]|uniref:GDP-mannose-dependent alpha-mannosyltransferase n=2 Tax=Pseudonocardia TaxID=1847 RepID=A0A1Y2N6H5_PSEAH|nr:MULTISPECIES: glycosyltransferase [Pseudonocardia]OSY42769.1 GDP-mannose-dependent alpha-mannosyltransferase [Pseudonocardia autotrophica]TDN77346.1 glycosyltransferase involved in cell wall biosynthesis [Pseudonocardia autotrophica]BBG01368.1 hypothetical protein Pdca_25770 [Pseudonocardia autotrophica]GEC24424.1 hypothetical protein PSA01_14530 [Pseudonocardia saturnea]
MRILIGADTYAPDVNGASYFAGRLAAGLGGRGHEVHVACPSRTLRGSCTVVPGTGIVEHRFASLPVPRPTDFRISVRPGLVHRARSLLRQVRPDVVHVQSHLLLGRALIVAAKAVGTPVVATTHVLPDNLVPYLPLGSGGLERARRWFWRTAVDVLGRADIVTAPTSYAARLMERHGVPGPVVTISNGLDLTRFHPDRDGAAFRRRHGLDDRPTVGYLGRLDPEKHLDELLAAVAALRRTTDAQLVIVGDGDRRPQLTALVRGLGLEHSVVMTGRLPDSEIPDAYAAMDVFVNPGTAELQSLVTLEAMATGRPVVAADAGALPHLVQHGRNGYRYPPGAPAVLAGHLDRLLARPDERASAGLQSLQIVGGHALDATLADFETAYTRAGSRPLRGCPAPAGTEVTAW